MTWHETSKNREDEERIARVLEPILKLGSEHIPASFIVDRAFLKSRLIGETIYLEPVLWAEIKTKAEASTARPWYELDLYKWLGGLRLSKETNLPFIVVVEFTDKTLYYLDRGDDLKTFMAGRWDRGLANDRRPHVFIPIKDMLPITNLPAANLI